MDKNRCSSLEYELLTQSFTPKVGEKLGGLYPQLSHDRALFQDKKYIWTVHGKLGSVKSPVTPGVTGDFTDPNFPWTVNKTGALFISMLFSVSDMINGMLICL